MPLAEDLYAIERELGDGDGDAYRRHLTDDAVVIVPGQALDKEATVRAMDESPGWDDSSFEDERLCSRTTRPRSSPTASPAAAATSPTPR